jgi:hypothetical protein
VATHTGARTRPRWKIGDSFAARYREVVASIYIYNEHRGYTSLDRVLAAARQVCPEDEGFIQAVAKHRADERKHYLMFKQWFVRQGRMPLATGRSYGHIDRFIGMVFGCSIDELEVARVVADPALFERLCRVIVLTEQRGLAQVEELLRNPMIRQDRAMHRIFSIVHRDEPDHFLPYRRWLEGKQRPTGTRREVWADALIHKVLLLVKLPGLFFRRHAPRMADWPDAGEVEERYPLPP